MCTKFVNIKLLVFVCKEQEETLQATLDFTADRLREVEFQLEKSRVEVDELNASIKASFNKKKDVYGVCVS